MTRFLSSLLGHFTQVRLVRRLPPRRESRLDSRELPTAATVAEHPASSAATVSQGNSVSGFWQQVQETAADIAIGADGSIWSVDADLAIARWTRNSWHPVAGASVSVDGHGYRWVIQSDGVLLSRLVWWSAGLAS